MLNFNLILFISSQKGEIPIEKNVKVVDEKGNVYEATYPKRAKGLVKNGRARFIDENTICLACPPDIENENISEDKIMTDINLNANVIENAGNNIEVSSKFNLDYALRSIEKIRDDTAYLKDTIEALKGMERSGGPGDVAGEAKGRALQKVAESREATNQALIRFYEKMYDDLKPQKEDPMVMTMVDLIKASINSGNLDAINELHPVLEILRQLRK